MSAGPRVSVVLPTYNRGTLLPRAIASVLNQSFADFELIVVDDASTDDTPAVVKRFADPRVRYERAPINRGDAAARNLGARHARGMYLAFQDSDDEWLPEKLAKQVAHLESLPPDCALVGCSILRVLPDVVSLIRWPVRDQGREGWVDLPRFLAGFPAYLQSVVVRRSAYDAVAGFDEALPINSDWDFCLRLFDQARLAALTQEVLVISHETAGSLSQRNDLRLVALERIGERHREHFARHPGAQSSHCYDFAKARFAAGQTHAGRRLAWQALRLDPRRPARWLLWLASWLGSRAVNALLAARRRRRGT